LLVATAPLACWLEERSRRIAVGSVAVIALLLSFGRAGWIGLAAGCVVGGIVLLGCSRWRHYAAFGAICILAFGAIGGVQPEMVARVSDIIPIAPARANQGERAFAQEVALDLWKREPLFGVGSGNTARAARQIPEYASIDRRIVPAHNWLILGLAERGALGATIMALLWCGPVFWLLIQGSGRAEAALATCLAALAASQWFDYEMTYWVGGSLIQVALLALWIRSSAL
jgi:O-antigen ligase